ncbi:hypothetical protein KRM28CT15_48410 [Krasilnikovia sp. M28-CT-15]
MAGWDGQAQHVAQIARVAVGDRAGQPGHLRVEDPLRGDDPVEVRELGVLRGLDAFEQEAADEPAGEPDPDPDPGLGGLVVVRRDEVIEGTVEVGQGHIDADTRDREPWCRLPVAFRAARWCHPTILPGDTDKFRQAAAALRSWARSVLSHSSSGSSRPK